MKTFEQKALVVSSVLLYLASLILLWFDTKFIYRWVTLYLHIFSLACLCLLLFQHMQYGLVKYVKNLKLPTLLPFFIILTLALSSRFLFLKSYPFVSLGDEVRDGGLQAQQIATGSLLNIFSYGRYDAHGLIIPTITSFFYSLFGPSILVYRIPAALLSVLDILIVYCILRIVLNGTAAFLGSLFLISLPLHIFYARTEVVVAFSSVLSSLNILFLLIYIKKRSAVSLLFLAMFLGFSSQFHTSIRIESLLIIGFLVFHQLYKLIKRKLYIRYFFILVILFWFVGFGPRILYTTPTIFFQTSRFPYAIENKFDSFQWKTLSDIPQKYLDTLRVWIDKPTTAWYPDRKPILTPVFFILFFTGLIAGIWKRKKLFLILLYLLLTVSFTNSAMTDMVNGDHRLSPMYPIAALFVGLGIHSVLTFVKRKDLRYGIIGVFILLCIQQLVQFFVYQPANKIRGIGDYVGMHAIYYLQAHAQSYGLQPQLSKPSICLYSSPANIHAWQILHAVEQKQYFLPQFQIELQPEEEKKDNEVYIQTKPEDSRQCPFQFTETSEKKIYCNDDMYACPKGYTGNISIFYDRLL